MTPPRDTLPTDRPPPVRGFITRLDNFAMALALYYGRVSGSTWLSFEDPAVLEIKLDLIAAVAEECGIRE